ncbi:nucleoside-diphosphate kinase [Candidatus Peregrinibacteria bacterium CG10_big_fil_rev_8_21_14_0_10_49_10]|nr:MAG: nucleoside-diphosphate kinase [Candidatus Peregrinibacteria bacterium CG10_big_fil_rev_8_21_14_0_10_49_10]
MERTLILLKPDAVSQKLCGKVIARFEEAGFTIRGCKMTQLTPEILAEHYAHIAKFPFYPDVEEFMKSTPVIALVLEGEGIIEKMRGMLGVTDCLQAPPGTIREQWGSKEEGKNKMCNIAHASDSAEAAEVEIKRFFASEELFDY